MKKKLLSCILTIAFAISASAQSYEWAKNVGGSGLTEGFYSLAVDAAGNVYIISYYTGTADFDPSAATVNLIATGNDDVFFAKYDTNGNLLWVNSLGSFSDDRGFAIALDAFDNVYVTGNFGGTIDFDPSAAIANLTSTGSSDMFFAKYDTNGNYIWAKNAGGWIDDWGFSLIVDSSGNIYITGGFAGTADFDPSAAVANLTSAGSWDGFFAKYDTNGNYIWAKPFGSPSNIGDGGRSIKLDASGNVYLTGHFNGTADFDPSAATASITSVGSDDAFFAKYDANGNYLWAKSLGTTNGDYGYSIEVDNLGNLYVTGAFNGTADFDPSAATANLTSTGGVDVYFAKYDTNGNYLWAKNIGSPLNDEGYATTLDASGNLYITGGYTGTVDFDQSAATAYLTSAGSFDGFFAKYDTNGNYIWAKSVGGLTDDRAYAIALDTLGNVYVTGYFAGTADFDPSIATANITSVGLRQVFFAKYSGNITSIEENKKQNSEISIYPNPAKILINFSVQTNIQLADLTGQIIANQKKVNALDVSNYPAGVYFVTFFDDNGQVLQRSKIVVQ